MRVMKSVAPPDPALDWGAIEALGIERLVRDSREVRAGDTFVAYPGASHDGRDYIGEAIARGAASVLWESEGFRWNPRWKVPNVGVRGLRRRAGEIAARLYGHPSRRLWVIGVTGTDGKTSCSQWIAQALNGAGRRCAVIGTLGYGVRPPFRSLANTTPDAIWLHAQLGRFARRGVRAVALEVSSIGLDQHRVEGVEFDVALLTHLSRDHLDYHRTMARYREAKARLFQWDSLRYAVLNLDDAFGRALARRIRRPGLEVIGYGFEPGRGAELQGSKLVADARGVRFTVRTPWGAARVASPVLGRHNAANLLGVLGALLASGMPLRRAAVALGRLAPLPGRMQRLGGGARPLVVVDYAHTPHALEKALLALRELLAGSARPQPRRQRRSTQLQAAPRLICVFGCGGERDRGKRPLMGRVAARLADRVIVTSDNPRGEDPRSIIEDIVAGARPLRGELEIEPDRGRAIRSAIAQARRGDVVLLAGKGHERFQEAGGRRRPFSDAEVARAALARWTRP
jgi:UDP-N-acetylmuramoyl-L-alanyl-D-glutamate--2,6-diaminopimelate ligase